MSKVSKAKPPVVTKDDDIDDIDDVDTEQQQFNFTSLVNDIKEFSDTKLDEIEHSELIKYATVANQIGKVLTKFNYDIIKEQDKRYSRLFKESKKKRKNKDDGTPRKNTGFNISTKIPHQAYVFITTALKNKQFSDEKTKEIESLNLTENTELPRTKITSFVYDYIKNNKLYPESDNNDSKNSHRKMLPDNHIIKLFDMKKEELNDFNFNTFQKYLARLYPKVKKIDSESESDTDTKSKIKSKTKSKKTDSDSETDTKSKLKSKKVESESDDDSDSEDELEDEPEDEPEIKSKSKPKTKK